MVSKAKYYGVEEKNLTKDSNAKNSRKIKNHNMEEIKVNNK